MFNKLRSLNITAKINILVVALLITFALIMTLVLQNIIGDAIKDSATEKAKGDLELSFQWIEANYPGEWHLDGDQLYRGDMLLNNNFELVDKLADVMNGDSVTVFVGDTRVATNVIKEDGNRAIGTQASDPVIKQTLIGGENFYGEANVVGHVYQTGYMPIKNSSGEILGMWYVGAPTSMITDVMKKVNMALLVTSIILIVGSVALLMLYTTKMKRRINNVAEALEYAGNGDFTKEVTDNTGDEISQLAHSYGRARDGLRNLISEINKAAGSLATSSMELGAGAEETSRASDSIAESLQEVAAASDDQVQHAQQLSDSVHSIATGLQQISSSAERVEKATATNALESNTGAKVMGSTMQQVLHIDKVIKSTAGVIQELNQKSSEIGNIINIITDIANQTNLLALNAAIEAARAGEHGKGFAVVAEEVRKLAEQSNVSASQIQELIDGIQEDISESIGSIEDGSKAISDGIELAAQAEESFKTMNDSTNETHEQIAEVSHFVQDINKGTEEMVQLLNNITARINDTSTETQSVAASSEEQNASMQEIYALSQTLNTLAEELRQSAGVFKI